MHVKGAGVARSGGHFLRRSLRRTNAFALGLDERGSSGCARLACGALLGFELLDAAARLVTLGDESS
jgi:hypothetical protein